MDACIAKGAGFPSPSKHSMPRHKRHWTLGAKIWMNCKHNFKMAGGVFICSRCLTVSDPTGMHTQDELPRCRSKSHNFVPTPFPACFGCRWCGAIVDPEAEAPNKPEDVAAEKKTSEEEEEHEESEEEEEVEENQGGGADYEMQILFGDAAKDTKKRGREE